MELGQHVGGQYPADDLATAVNGDTDPRRRGQGGVQRLAEVTVRAEHRTADGHGIRQCRAAAVTPPAIGVDPAQRRTRTVDHQHPAVTNLPVPGIGKAVHRDLLDVAHR